MNENLNAVQLVFDEIIKSQTINQVLNNLEKINKNNINLAAIAYSWVLERIKERELKPFDQKSIRLISAEEAEVLGNKNYSYLLHFYNLGLIDVNEIDRFITQLQIIPKDLIDQKLINILLVAFFLYSDTQILPGSRLHLFSSDTIN